MTLTTILAIVFGAVLVFWAVGARSRLVRLRGDSARQFAPVQVQIERRNALLMQWAASLQPMLENDLRPLEALFAACNQVQAACGQAQLQPTDARTLSSLRLAEETLAAARTRLLAELPAQVDRLILSGSSMAIGMTVASRHEELAAVDSTLAFARHQFNATAHSYNEAVRQFPAWIIAGLFGLGAVGTL